MELLFALRKGQPQLAAFAEGLSCALPPVAAFLLGLAVCRSRQRSLILVALPSFRTASLMQSACSNSDRRIYIIRQKVFCLQTTSQVA